MAFDISVTRTIKADQEFVFEWWTDLSSDDAKLVKPLKSRKILSRTPTTVILQDEEEMYFRRMKYDVKVTLDRPRMWVSEYEGKVAKAKSEYVLSQGREGSTILSYHTHIEPRGFLTNLFSPIIKHFVKRVFAGEMTVFIRTLEAEYRQKQKTVS